MSLKADIKRTLESNLSNKEKINAIQEFIHDADKQARITNIALAGFGFELAQAWVECESMRFTPQTERKKRKCKERHGSI